MTVQDLMEILADYNGNDKIVITSDGESVFEIEQVDSGMANLNADVGEASLLFGDTNRELMSLHEKDNDNQMDSVVILWI
ncbi:MAG: hypothetical protein DRN27_05300 [Thermoplasmata archaeon]|nr:MAG: hypothetical protein DRN27_05300 [Thermoplasmata archaeon]